MTYPPMPIEVRFISPAAAPAVSSICTVTDCVNFGVYPINVVFEDHKIVRPDHSWDGCIGSLEVISTMRGGCVPSKKSDIWCKSSRLLGCTSLMRLKNNNFSSQLIKYVLE